MPIARIFSKTVFLALPSPSRRQPRRPSRPLELSYKDKKFTPAEVTVPANTAFTIKVKNLDAKAMEFESKPLKIEKVIAANSEAIVNVRAQKPGKYKFVDEYNEDVAFGNVIVK